jgi:hypothetical protein
MTDLHRIDGGDLERNSSSVSDAKSDSRQNEKSSAGDHVPPTTSVTWRRWKILRLLEVESRGIVPTQPVERTDPQFWKIFFLWLSANLNILS